MLGKLAVYVRVYFDTDAKPVAVSANLKLPWGQVFDLGIADASLVEKAIRDAKAQNHPLAGLILKGMFTPLPVPSPGTILAHIKIGDRECVCGALTLVVLDQTSPDAGASQPQA
jgi:hypothetical protein